ncbi:MAG: SPFH domain-containing protein [Phycisphaerae bacterium]|nr:SPFH domain-containing protein [Phycisphaerae bacterium]
MDIFGKVKEKLMNELIDIVEWLDDSRDTLVYRFQRYQNEIKNGAKLIVREGQTAVFVNEGQIADVFRPGTYTLDTKNLPILATLRGWKYGFNSPFKAEVYFVNTRQFTDLKWGTANPIMLRDAEFGPVRLRAYGTYAMRVSDAGTLVKEIAGTNGRLTIDGLTDQIRNFIVSRFSESLAESKIPALDLAANYSELGGIIAGHMKPAVGQYGIELTTLLVENISLPPEVEQALDARTKMGVIGDLSRYTQFQTAEALRDAAKNPGGNAAAGMGAGMGFAMAQQMAQSLGQAQQAAAPGGHSAAAPPPLPNAAVAFFVGINGTQAGPFDAGTLAAKVRAGEITRDTLVWKQGMANWAAAGSVTDLASFFASTPPPLPPQ